MSGKTRHRDPLILNTEHLTMSPMLAEDVESICRIAREPGVRRYLFDDKPVALEFIGEVLAQSLVDFQERQFGIWILRHKNAGSFIGFCGLRFAPDLSEVEILYALSESQWGHGYAIEAASSVLRYAFDTARLDRVIGITDVANAPSWRVLEKLGMHEYRPAGARDDLRYASIGRDDPRAR